MIERREGTDTFDVLDAKRAIRARMRAIRRVIASDPARRAERSAAISERLVALVECRAELVRRVMTYDALPGEVDLTVFHDWCRAKGVDVFGPIVDAAAPDQLRVVPGDVDPAVLDVVVVPGLAFTPGGHRLGQGGGHFDRFLPRLASDCLRVGVCFREQLVDELPVEAHDVVVDRVVTDEHTA